MAPLPEASDTPYGDGMATQTQIQHGHTNHFCDLWGENEPAQNFLLPPAYHATFILCQSWVTEQELSLRSTFKHCWCVCRLMRRLTSKVIHPLPAAVQQKSDCDLRSILAPTDSSPIPYTSLSVASKHLRPHRCQSREIRLASFTQTLRSQD